MSEPNGLSRARRGFTLVELLVVITIIMLLVGLLVVLIRGMVDRSRNAKTTAIVKMLDQGCHEYHTDYGKFPPQDMPKSQSLHKYLGADRIVTAAYVEPGRPAPTIKKPPIIDFRIDMLEGPPASTDPNPPVNVIDAWGKVIEYANPGTYNKKAVDIWSLGKDDADPEDDMNNWVKDF